MNPIPIDLDAIKVRTPCHVPWDDMRGDESKRFCSSCRLNVYDLSQMTRVEATELIRKSEGRLCARFYRRPDGTVLTKDCGVVRARRAKRWAALSTGLSLLLLTQGLAFFSPKRSRGEGIFSPTDVVRIRSTSLYQNWAPIRSTVDWMNGVLFPPPPSSYLGSAIPGRFSIGSRNSNAGIPLATMGMFAVMTMGDLAPSSYNSANDPILDPSDGNPFSETE